MRIPKTGRINIGGHVIRIVESTKHKHPKQLKKNDGLWVFRSFTILLRRKLKRRYKRMVFGHEVEHAIHDICGVTLKEGQIEALNNLRDGMYKLNKGL